MTVIRGEVRGDNWGESGKGHPLTCIKNLQTKLKGGWIEGGRWEWLESGRVEGVKWRQLLEQRFKRIEKNTSGCKRESFLTQKQQKKVERNDQQI